MRIKKLSLDPQFTKVWIGLGLAFFYKEQYPEAIEAYRKALKLDPQFTKAWIGLGNALNNNKQYTQAD